MNFNGKAVKISYSKQVLDNKKNIENRYYKSTNMPNGWKLVSFEDILKINPPKPPKDLVPSDTEVTFIPMSLVDADSGTIALKKTQTFSKVIKGYSAFQNEDVIFAKITPCMENGKAAIARNLSNNLGFGSTEFIVLRSKGAVVPEYLHHYIRQKHYRKMAESNMTGSVGQKRVPKTFISNSLIPLAPLPEQRAIVSKIEQLFSELDNGIANLKLAQEQLKVYRQAVLKKAFEGELTKQWREQQPDLPDAGELLEQIRAEREENYKRKLEEWKEAVKEWENGGKAGKKPAKPKNPTEIEPFTKDEIADLAKLPGGWGWTRLGEVGYWTGGGTPSKQKKSYWTNGNVLWVSPKDMKTKLIVDTEDKITKNSILNSSAKWICEDSILFVVRSGIIKRVLPIALAGKNLTTNQDLQSLTLFFGDKNYVFWYCQANEQMIRTKCAKDGTTVDNIEVPRLKSYPIAICSLPEQQAIVNEIETRFSVWDKVEQDIAENLEKAEALRQSILKKAFEGKLLGRRELEEVRGSPDWEPAEVLLERINSEKKTKADRG
jgi:type I restriction enzyme S subunit